MHKPLSGYRVLDLSRILAGPWATQLLADLGADVIKVERPGQGDDTRGWGPPYLQDRAGEDTSDAAYFCCANRNKRSITIDINQAEGAKLVRDLARQSDVLVENFKTGGLKKYQLDYASIQAINPRLVYCSITGFGQTGPLAQRAGYDFLIQGMAGLMSITGEPDSAGGMPTKVGVAVSDLFTGLYAANAVQAALLERATSGEGQYIDLALLDVQAAVLANQASNYLVGNMVPQRLGNAHPNIVPYQAFASADGHIILAVGNDQQFQSFCNAAARPDLASSDLYQTNRLRVENRETLCATIADTIRAHSTRYWIDLLEQAGVPCGPINSIDQVFAAPQIKARNMRVSIPEPRSGHIELAANPIRFSRTPISYDRPPPQLGESTDEVLTELLGYSESKIVELRNKGVI